MTMARLHAALAAVALLLLFFIPASARADGMEKVRRHVVYMPANRIYPLHPWGFPHQDLGWKYPMFGEYIPRGPYYFHRVYYYLLPPYRDCCW